MLSSSLRKFKVNQGILIMIKMWYVKLWFYIKQGNERIDKIKILPFTSISMSFTILKWNESVYEFAVW